MALMHIDFFAHTLGMCMQMEAVIPQQSDRSKPWRTLYLLHGMSDDETMWQRRTSVERYAEDAGIAVIMPTTHLAWYTDMHHGLKYFTYISEELVRICRGFFPQMSDKPEDTFVAGLSMGGYGAVKCALLRPETFGAAATFSGALDIAREIDRGHGSSYFTDIFGEPGTITGGENDLYAAAERLRQSGRKLPPIYQWCGTEDGLLEENRAYYRHLTGLGYQVSYHESAGGHEWHSWDLQVEQAIRWFCGM